MQLQGERCQEFCHRDLIIFVVDFSGQMLDISFKLYRHEARPTQDCVEVFCHSFWDLLHRILIRVTVMLNHSRYCTWHGNVRRIRTVWLRASYAAGDETSPGQKTQTETNIDLSNHRKLNSFYLRRNQHYAREDAHFAKFMFSCHFRLEAISDD